MTKSSILKLLKLETVFRSPEDYVISCLYFNVLSFTLNRCFLKVGEKIIILMFVKVLFLPFLKTLNKHFHQKEE